MRYSLRALLVVVLLIAIVATIVRVRNERVRQVEADALVIEKSCWKQYFSVESSDRRSYNGYELILMDSAEPLKALARTETEDFALILNRTVDSSSFAKS
ncbi:MAG: hypothetical protein QM811_26945 [Pirellulales bacterium]